MDAGDLDGSATDLEEVRARDRREVSHLLPAQVHLHPCLGKMAHSPLSRQMPTLKDGR